MTNKGRPYGVALLICLTISGQAEWSVIHVILPPTTRSGDGPLARLENGNESFSATVWLPVRSLC